MTQQEATALFDKYRRGVTTEGENALIESWYLNEAGESAPVEEEIDYMHKEQQIWGKIEERRAAVGENEVVKETKLWPRIAGIAAAVAAVVFGIWFFNYRTEIASVPRNNEVVVNDIKPGKNTATLTLANGKTIQLSDAQTGVIVNAGSLKYNDQSEVASSLHFPRNEGEAVMLTASTPRGGTYQVTLPDGTQVWLNADSKISFPSQFTGTERKILLEGEAYFEVTTSYTSLRGRRMKQSFIVESGGQRVEVLGTHFNISAYEDEKSIRTTLLEGSVKVSQQPKPGVQIGKGFSEVLKPKQQAIFNGNSLDVITANIEQTMAWKNGMIVFQKQSLRDMMRGLSRWYNVEVVFEPGVENMLFTGSISRFTNISTVLRVLELTGKIHFKIEGRRVTIMK